MSSRQEIEISVPVADEIASWRRIFEGRKDGVDARNLLRKAAADLWAVLEIDKTVHPRSNATTRQAVVDALFEVAEFSGIAPDDAQSIFAEGFKKQPSKSDATSAPSEKKSNGKAEEQPLDEGVTVNNFRGYMPAHSYIFEPSREMWPASSVNSRIEPIPASDANGNPVVDEKGRQKVIPASTWIDQNRSVEQMTWAPGLPMLIEGRLISDGGWIERKGVTCFNLYRPPTIEPGNALKAERWLDHIHKVFGDDDIHIAKWLAHRVQYPQDKINHALVLGGAQGIGKDTLLQPLKSAVGPWNFHEVSPKQITGRFNGFLKSVILRVSEARDLGDSNRFDFYDSMKSYTAAPPDVLRVDEKHLREYNVLNCCGIIITTNYKADGIYLPADDRRHYVAWSNLEKKDFTENYWNEFWGWYDKGGIRHVVAYLIELDISAFDAKAPPPKTPAFWDIVDASRAPEDAELADIIDAMGKPDVTTIKHITTMADGEFGEWIRDRKNRRAIPHRLETCGYVPVRNDTAEDGLWVINSKRQAVYANSNLPIRDQLREARDLTNASELPRRQER
jgi:hypothetical protein